MSDTTCPLCFNLHCGLFHQDKRRRYYQCPQCRLVFAERASLLSSEDELAQYQLHNNDVNDTGYRHFLQRLAGPLLAALPAKGLTGLDFGCGPGPLLARMLTEAGQHMSVWDPYFAADASVLQQKYDFISCSEAIEHFARPATEWALWLNLLKPQGTLAIMTKRYTTAEAFANWHYKLDPTHVSFFSDYTFSYLAQRDGFSVNFADKDVVILQRTKH